MNRDRVELKYQSNKNVSRFETFSTVAVPDLGPVHLAFSKECTIFRFSWYSANKFVTFRGILIYDMKQWFRFKN